MFNIVSISVLCILVAVFEIIPMYKNNKKKEIVLYTIVMVISMSVTIFISTDISYPSFASILKKLLLPIIPK